MTLIAVMLPVLLLFFAFAVDVGNWFQHKRHLQLQVDAGALAAAAYFNGCISDSAAANAAILAEASKYSGDPSVLVRYNPQVGPTPDLAYRFNSKTYATGGPPPDDTVEGQPCAAKMLDVKISQRDLPWFLFPDRHVPVINARARVEVREVDVQQGSLPFAVPNIQPHYMRATFVNEADGSVLGGTDLTFDNSVSPLNGLDIWDNASTPYSLTVPSGVSKVGVRIRVNEGFTASADCGAALVSCYLTTPTTEGVTLIRGYSTTAPDTSCASGSNCPVARTVRLLAGSCVPDAYFAVEPCSVGLEADLDFSDHTGPTPSVWANVPGTRRDLDLSAPSTGTVWFRTTDIPSSELGDNAVTLSWAWKKTSGTWRDKTCTNGSGNPCQDSGTFGAVHRSYIADVPSGPLQLVEVGESGVALNGANSFQQGTTHDVVLRVGIPTLHSATSFNDPTVLLRIASPSGSSNHAIDCDAGRNLRDEIATGCETPYQRNPTLLCPDPGADPSDCAQIQTGDAVGQVKQGMDDHFAPDGVCSQNNWVQDPLDPDKLPVIDPSDPRLVPLIITTWNAFDVSGNGWVPVVRFGAFYVTGWNGNIDCSSYNAPAPPGTRANSADVWGHYVMPVLVGGGSTGAQPCNFDEFGTCVAILTR